MIYKEKVRLWVQVDDSEIGLVFAWDDIESAWICKMTDNFMKGLGPVPYKDIE